jgi:hypothetical protein
MAEEVGITYSSCHSILTDDLGINGVSVKFLL